MNHPIRFDDSLPIFAALVLQEWDQSEIEANLFLRDATERLTFIVLNSTYSTDDRSALAAKAVNLLGYYVDGNDFAVATPDELFDDRL